ncbi:segregation and condensation protein B [Oribacterium sp. oral taxon 078 str. F0263]|uniref:SMC-Scp complex subunit ScpB n=1 Tax=Oribacterium sp. oral taxon 078 TaxID=652706 RepID=UPI0003AE52B6|nr:SMC-Scp complex subunit ScpB [Oribacterium sp. oral taxon 078]ERL21499.1 segregation and condensation protein B [Oribacterium sp. oral taxon 078 str. F0263]
MSLNPVQERLVGEIDEEYKEELREEEKIVEALLFAMGRAVSREEIATALGTGPEAAEEAAERLYRSYRERNGGILIRRLEESYQMYTNPAQFEALIRVAKHPKKPVMTDVVMETLAIVAYRQPVTKAEIEKIRGVKSDHAVNRLVEYGLIYEEGRLNAPGRPALFATTEEFLRRFGAESIKDLPALSEEIEASIETEVKEELADALGLSGEEEEAASGDALPPSSSEGETAASPRLSEEEAPADPLSSEEEEKEEETAGEALPPSPSEEEKEEETAAPSILSEEGTPAPPHISEEEAPAAPLSFEEEEKEEAAAEEALPLSPSEWEEEIVLSALQEEENEAAASTAFEEKEEAPTPPLFQKEEIPPKAPSEGRDEAKEEANAPHPESGAGAGEEPGPV